MRARTTSWGAFFIPPEAQDRIGTMAPHLESPSSSTDQEFTYMAVGMGAGAVPGVLVGLLISLSLGNPAMWVSITGGVGIIVGLVVAVLLYKKKKKGSRS